MRYPNPLGMGLLIRRGNVPGVLKFLGMQDIDVGDAAFDKAFIVKGTNEPLVRQVVHAQMRAELMGLAGRGATVTVLDDRLEAWLPGIISDGKTLDELLFRGMAVVRGFWRR